MSYLFESRGRPTIGYWTRPTNYGGDIGAVHFNKDLKIILQKNSEDPREVAYATVFIEMIEEVREIEAPEFCDYMPHFGDASADLEKDYNDALVCWKKTGVSSVFVQLDSEYWDSEQVKPYLKGWFLTKLLNERGLSKSGNKEDKIQRLKDYTKHLLDL